MEIILTLDNNLAEQLKTLAEYCGVSESHLAATFIKDSTLSFLKEQNELRDSLQS